MSLRNVDIVLLARTSWNDMVWIKRILDIGVEGIVVPCVNSCEETETLIHYASYLLRGVRGVGSRRAVRYDYHGRGFLEYHKTFEEESNGSDRDRRAVENVEEIASVEDVDGPYVDPMDLSMNLGIPLQYDHPELRDTLRRIREVQQGSRNTHSTPEQTSKYIEMGFRFIALMIDIGVMLFVFRDMLKALKRSR